MSKKSGIYLDFNATSPLHPSVKGAYLKAVQLFGNPSSLHAKGREAQEAMSVAREGIAAHLDARSSHLFFTGSGSESNNAALYSAYFRSLHLKKNCHIVVSEVEHASVLETCMHLKKLGVKVTTIPVSREGVVLIDVLEKIMESEPDLVSVMWVNNETGVIQPVEKVLEVARSRGVLVHVDAVQAWGKMPVSLRRLDADFVSLSGHKVGGPKGIGLMVLRDEEHFVPLIRGGGQERRLRAGTENIPGILALGEAVAHLAQDSSFLK